DPYKALGVSKDASANDIKKAYFQLAKKYHPDTNKDPASKERFLEIQNAYEILGDEQKKQAYDTYGEASQQPGFDQNPFGAGNPFAGAGGFSRGFAGSGGTVEDLFSTLFGGGPMSGRARASTRGDDIEISISVSFMEAAKGTSKTVNVTPVSDCSTCTGTGMKTGKKRTQCPTCRGTGQQTFVLNSGFQMASTCSTCQGAGSTIPRGAECDDCGGVGKIKYRKQVKIEVPADCRWFWRAYRIHSTSTRLFRYSNAVIFWWLVLTDANLFAFSTGVEDGMTVRVPGEGDAPMSTRGSNGDLLVRVNVSSSNVWRRQGTNLYYDAPIPLHTAVLGGRIRVPTLDGEVEVRVAPGTQPGEDAVLRGRGVQSVMHKAAKGDLFISYMVQVPRNLSRRQKELMQQFADEVEGRAPAQTPNSSSSSTGSTAKSNSTSASDPPSPSAAG
ncbi:1469_t:CDS:2, partial [Acaulospora colombiana]